MTTLFRSILPTDTDDDEEISDTYDEDNTTESAENPDEEP